MFTLESKYSLYVGQNRTIFLWIQELSDKHGILLWFQKEDSNGTMALCFIQKQGGTISQELESPKGVSFNA
jgi:hypothetical protein